MDYTLHIEPLKNGNFKYSMRYVDVLRSRPGKTVYRRVFVTLTKNTKPAQNRARTILQDKIKLKYASAKKSDITLAELYDLYKDYIGLEKPNAELNPKYQTHYVYNSHIHQFLNSPDIDENMIVDNLNIPFFRKYFDSLDYSYSYLRVRRAALSDLFSFGVQYGYIQSNPIRDFRLVPKRKTEADVIEDKYFTDEEYKAIIEYLDQHDLSDYSDFFQFMYYTGLRQSEASSIQPIDIFKKDDKYFVSIDGIMVRKHNSNKLEKSKQKKRHGTKTNSSTRIIYLPDKAVDIVKRLAKCKKPDDFIFRKKKRNYGAKPFSNTDVNQMLERLQKNLNISKKITSHFFRHTHVSKLAEMGMSLEDIKKRVGHKDVKTTEMIYYHITDKRKKKNENIIDKL